MDWCKVSDDPYWICPESLAPFTDVLLISRSEPQPDTAFTLLGWDVGQQEVIGLAVGLALVVFLLWKIGTHRRKYDPFGARDE